MTTIINADTSTGGAIISGDASGVLALQAAGVTKVTINSSGVTLAAPLPVASGGTGGSATPTAGGVVYGTGSAQAITSAGTAGYLLQSNGASAPSWVAAPSASAMTLISTQNPSNAAYVAWTGLSGYSTYMLVVNATLPYSGTGQFLFMDFGVGSTPTYISANYSYAKVYNPGSSSATGDGSGGYSSIFLVRPGAGSGSRSLSGSWTITTGIGADSGTPDAHVMGTAYQAASTAINASGGWLNLGAPLTAIRLYYSADNIGSGKFSLYGIST